jgi:hypothetical protein
LIENDQLTDFIFFLCTIHQYSLSPKETKRVHFPMMAVVDYRGFRLLAVSLLPIGNRRKFFFFLQLLNYVVFCIDRSTCVYGSPDGGATVKQHFMHLLPLFLQK